MMIIRHGCQIHPSTLPACEVGDWEGGDREQSDVRERPSSPILDFLPSFLQVLSSCSIPLLFSHNGQKSSPQNRLDLSR